MATGKNKRGYLVEAADQLVHQQGFRQTTLSDIARESGVPLGNLYYYFKSKDDIGKAVIESRVTAFRSLIDGCNRYPDAKQRLTALLDYPEQNIALLTERGCPVGTLCYELSHLPDAMDLHRHSKALMAMLLDWSESQFEQLDRENARLLALRFVSELQGMTLIANTMEDPQIITSMLQQTRHWIAAL